MSGDKYSGSIADLITSEIAPEDLPPPIYLFHRTKAPKTSKSDGFQQERESPDIYLKKKKKSKKRDVQDITGVDATSVIKKRKRKNEEVEEHDLPLEPKKRKSERVHENDEAVPKKKKDKKQKRIEDNEFQSDDTVKLKKKSVEGQSYVENVKEERVGKKARHEKGSRRSVLKKERFGNNQTHSQDSFFESDASKTTRTRMPSSQENDDEDDQQEGNTPTFSNVPKRKERELEARTVFVGNVPVSYNKKKMKKLMSKFGSIETIRFRSAPVSNPAYSKRVSFITKDFKSDRRSVNCYVRYKSIDEAHRALDFGGTTIDGLTVRTDIAAGRKSRDNSKAVFIGNVPFEAEEEELREEFCSCGEIEDVRIIRDPVTCAGKGFAYINFASSDGAQLAMELDGKPLHGRTLRVKACVKKVKGKSDERNIKKGSKNFKTSGAVSRHGKPSRGGGRSFRGGKKQERPKTTAPSYAGEQTAEVKTTKKVKKPFMTKEERLKRKYAKMLSG